jgi:hypothetical protein
MGEGKEGMCPGVGRVLYDVYSNYESDEFRQVDSDV